MLVHPLRAMTVKELVEELNQYPGHMGIYIGSHPDEDMSKENLTITRREPHSGDPAILHLRTMPLRGK